MSTASRLQAIPGSEQWRALFFTRGPRVATWLLALAVGVQAAIIVTDLAGAGHAPSPGAIAAASRAQHAPVDIAAITNTHLFGIAPAAAGAGNAANAPQTSMPLVLTGVIAANDPRDGLAILGPSVAATKVYAVGDNIPGGARLHAVLSDHVLLERNGQLETLALPHQLAGSAPPPNMSAAPVEPPVVQRMRELVSRDPGIIGDIMRPEPVFAGGKQQGFRVYPGRDREAFIRLGLKPGDLVTAIDGTPLDDPARGEQILSTLGSSSEAHVTVLRNGQQQDLTLDLAAVEQEAESLAGSQNGAPGVQAPPPPPPRSLPFAPPRRGP
ncbi:MAG TPA: type II secretion system protein GspC [Steroidobacteraceae bacterium]|nr:type II secretion system protein GspC [Steroidobacteraceae bacterium]